MKSTGISGRRAGRRAKGGFTVVELAMACAIIGRLGAVAVSLSRRDRERQARRPAADDLNLLQAASAHLRAEFSALPDSLNGIADPYRNLRDPADLSRAREDENLVPIDSDCDLHGKVCGGESAAPLTSARSRDGVVRANDRAFVGRAADD